MTVTNAGYPLTTVTYANVFPPAELGRRVGWGMTSKVLVSALFGFVVGDHAGAVMARDLNWCMRTGGNIYFLAKIGATDGKSFQQMAGSMTGMTEDEYRDMMVNGGRSVEGNRRIGEHGDAQAHRQPQGQAGKHTHRGE